MDNEREFVTLQLESGEVVCEVIAVFDAGERQYCALLPQGGRECLIFRCFEAEVGFAEFENIDDDAEYTAAADELNRLLSEG
jgi:hypothetical protein